MFTINALDEEFAVATGSNVNSGPNQSTFDDPPSSSRGLSITANSDDPSPSTFSVGDTYDLAYGNSGSGTDAIFEDAEVNRSDALPGGGHVVVFEGINQDGELEQIVWTPGFDLESWYSDVSDQGATAGFYTSDQDASTQYEHAFVCFSSDTCIRTPSGDIPAGKLKSKWKRKRVPYATKYRPGTIIVNTKEKYLYLVEKGGTAMRYGVGVGKQGFTWAGTAKIGWKRQWPTWTPPPAMIRRKPELAKYRGGKPGGLDNPLGARAMYLMRGGRDTLYRIHGSPEWWSIGTNASSGCIRLMNHDIIDLYNRVKSGARVVVEQG